MPWAPSIQTWPNYDFDQLVLFRTRPITELIQGHLEEARSQANEVSPIWQLKPNIDCLIRARSVLIYHVTNVG